MEGRMVARMVAVAVATVVMARVAVAEGNYTRRMDRRAIQQLP